MLKKNTVGTFPEADSHGCISRHVRRLKHQDTPGGAQIVSQDGYLFVGHISPPAGTSIFDVRDPKNPSLVTTIELVDSQSHSHKVMVHGDLMIVNSQRHRRKFFRKSEVLDSVEARLALEFGRQPTEEEIAQALNVKSQDIETLRTEFATGYKNGGFRIYDISNPARPREICFQPTGGMGAHGFDFDGQYAYVSTEMPGFKGNILVIYSLTIPEKPQEISRWWMPEQETEGMGTGPVNGHWLHHALRNDNTLWAACSHSGVWAIDITDINHPVTAGSYNYHPPFIESTHTVMGLPQIYQDKKLALAIDEEHDNHPRGQPHAALWILDVTDKENIQPLSVFEVSELDSPWSRSGCRFGASQIVERPTGNLTFAAWFAGGLRVIDIGDPLSPAEYGYFIPPPPQGFTTPQSMDVEVDERGIVYLLDRNRGLDILEIF
ncbi:MAG: RNA polymerase subunit sigma-70 [Desulfobacterales bacterium]|nr:RNA polymerase subunit sigma-70 [Desulfobacterales bacterium]